MNSSPTPPKNICNNIDPTTRNEKLDGNISEIGTLTASGSKQDVSEDQINSLLAKLDDPDPRVRIDTVVKLHALCRNLPWNLSWKWIGGLEYRLHKETNVYVITAILKSLFASDNGSRITKELHDLSLCDRDQTLRELAIDQAVKTSEVGILIALWEKHPTASNAELIYPIAMRMLKQGLPYGYELLEKIGRAPTTEEMSQIYSTEKLSMSKNRDQMLSLIGSLGGFNSSEVFKEEFEHEHDPGIRRNLAQVILNSQLEPKKPPYPDNELCIPREETLAKRLPYIEKEIERLLNPENQKYFEAAWIDDIQSVNFTFGEWGSSLKSPKDRIEFWDRVLSMIPENSKDLRRRFRQQLAYAHASYAGKLMLTNRRAAKNEIATTEALIKDVFPGTSFPFDLNGLNRWIERKPEHPSVGITDLIGTYIGSSGDTGYTLVLKQGNVYEFEGQSDNIDSCTGGRWKKEGSFLIDGDNIVLIPGPLLSSYGFEIPEVLVPFTWGKQVLLLGDSSNGPSEFCNFVNSGKFNANIFFWGWYHRKIGELAEEETTPIGNPAGPKNWTTCILKEPLHTRVIKIEEKGVIVLNMGKDHGLQSGMKLYLENSPKIGTWKISEVSAKQSHAVPFGEVPTITIGEKLSTKIPD